MSIAVPRAALRGLLLALSCAALPLVATHAHAADRDAPGHDAHAAHAAPDAHSSHEAHESHDGHDAHAPRGAGPARGVGTARSVAPVVVPHIELVRQDGRKVDFARDLDDGRPVFLNFVYTTCTAICVPLSQGFADFQAALGAGREKVRLVSVSIDPEQDTPRRLAEYARRFGAGPQWTFYTGSVESSIAVQKAFSAYRGDKMNHTPLTLFRAAPGQPWVRIDGFASTKQMLGELEM